MQFPEIGILQGIKKVYGRNRRKDASRKISVTKIMTLRHSMLSRLPESCSARHPELVSGSPQIRSATYKKRELETKGGDPETSSG